ncbi:MAG: hypothetical protein LW853_04100, partial [Rickettsiales bacterium]|nr:hypothetical protein [Rickettsiales bacterium]
LSVEDGALIDGKFKRTDKVFSDEDDITRPAVGMAGASAVDFENDNDNQEPISAEELKLLENLRLIS